MSNGKRFSLNWLLPVMSFIVAGLFFVSAFVILFRHAETPQTSKSHLTFEPPKIHFDKISQGITPGKVIVTNTSKKRINIDSIKKSCDCTEVRLEQGSLPPGESREMSFQWDTRGRRGKDVTTIQVIYSLEDDTAQHSAPFVLSATVIPDFDITPNQVTFFANDAKSQTFSLVQAGKTDICIEDVFVEHPALSVSLADDRCSATVSYDPNKWFDDVRRLDVRLSTSSKNEPVVYVYVFIDVEDPDFKKFRQSNEMTAK